MIRQDARNRDDCAAPTAGTGAGTKRAVVPAHGMADLRVPGGGEGPGGAWDLKETPMTRPGTGSADTENIAVRSAEVVTDSVIPAFRGRLEDEFRHADFQQSLPMLRVALLVGGAFYAVFALLDLVVAPGSVSLLWGIRFGIVVPATLVLFLLTRSPRFERWMQPAVAAWIVLAGGGIVAMVGAIPSDASHVYYVGLILVLIIGYTYARLRFGWASGAGWLIVIAYQAVAVVIDTPFKTLIVNDFFFIGANVLGMLSCRAIEQYARDNFLLVRKVRTEQERVAAANQELADANRELARQALLDGLTGIPNRRSFDRDFTHEWARMQREGMPLTLVMCDIDRFKAYNDACGHLVGDDCLRDVAAAVWEAARRPADHVARYGGEEFALILPHTGPEGGRRVAEAVRKAVRRRAIPHPRAAVDGIVTVSLGVASILPIPEVSPEALLEAADRAMYQAKSQGRDRVVAADPLEPPSAPSNRPSRFRRREDTPALSPAEPTPSAVSLSSTKG